MKSKKIRDHETPPLENHMPKIPNTLRIGAIYYARKRVPADLEKALGKKEIRVSLRTTDYREAARKLPFELARLEAQFAEERQKLPRLRPIPTELSKLTAITNSEAMQIVASWFIARERETEKWFETTGINLDSDEKQEVEQNVSEDLAAYTASNGVHAPDDGSRELDRFLAERRMTIPKDSEAYKRLRGLFRQGLVEHSMRVLDRLQRNQVTAHDPKFAQWVSSSEPPAPAKKYSLGELIAAFTAHHKEVNPKKTLLNYQIPMRLLEDYFGKKTLLESIGPQEMGKFFDVLVKAPVNARQRYKTLGLMAAIAAADKKGDNRRLAPKTLENYYRLLVALFNFAVEMKMMEANPASNRVFRKRFEMDDDERVPRALFTIEELNQLFRAPLYTGCLDDETGYTQRGPNVPKRGRYWVPLLALFHGFRSNEACQIYTEDVKQEDDTWFIWIREGLEDGTKAPDKRLKNSSSKRRVPIHAELVRLGFLDFVNVRKADTTSPRLFPELTMDKQGAYSGPFSKFFGRFREKAAPKSKATFHSLRHSWRTALLHADVSVADVEALGGWESERRSSEKEYSHGQLIQKLKAQIDKVQFPGLDLSHLYPPQKVRVRLPLAPTQPV